MKVLKPIEAAYAADNVYRVMYSNDLSIFHPSLESKFNLSAGTRFKGVSGAMVFKSKSGFGVIAKGKGEFKGDAIIAVRGTSQVPYDLLTDFNIGIQTSSTGKLVHAGFNKTFKSFESDITRFLRGMNPHRIHCIGHSLGGALATLVADMIAEKNIARPVLYTFGAPRTGVRQFAESLTNRVKDKNIFRVCHSNDVVPMIPLWPFMHVPQPGTECYVKSPLILKSAHSMEGYIDSVANADWPGLKVKAPKMDWDAEVETWLGSKSIISFSFHTMKMINNAIIYILKKIIGLGMNVLFGTVTTGLTLLDQMAMLLEKGARASKEVAGYVMRLMQKILSMLGRAVHTVAELTIGFIRYVLTALSRSLYQIANSAITTVHSALH